jgi:hypothetical protein
MPAPAVIAAPARSPLPAAIAAPAPVLASAPDDDEAEWARLRGPVQAAAPAPVVAAERELTEDEWEWEIAMARVRAAAADVSDSASAMQFTKPTAPAPRPSAPKTMPMAAAMGRPEPMPAWPKTEPLATAWDDRTEASAPPHVMSPVEKEIAVARRSTVIPVPQHPLAARPSDVRPPPSTRTISPRTRMARGTAREDTVVTKPIAAANEDHTSPYVTLPSEVRASTGYAHTRRAAAKHR